MDLFGGNSTNHGLYAPDIRFPVLFSFKPILRMIPINPETILSKFQKVLGATILYTCVFEPKRKEHPRTKGAPCRTTRSHRSLEQSVAGLR